MAKWKYKCIGCEKIVPIVCTNCNRKEFKGHKKKCPGYHNDEIWLECSHCKNKFYGFNHNCGASTRISLNRKNFFRSYHNGSGSELPGGKLFPILFFSMIIFLLIILL